MTGSVFGAALRQARERRGVSLAGLARLTHYSKGYLSRIETGDRQPTAQLAERCDEALRAAGSLARLVTDRPRRSPASLPRPAQLPAATPGFTGRAGPLAQLDEALDDRRGSMPVTVITGLPGIGKTALAVYWACKAARRFPDGQLYVNLRGFSPAGSPITPGEALHGFLLALAVPPEQVPADLDAQAGLYRSMLAGRRILVVADNARDAEQVRPLLPGAPGSAVVVTSRNSLTSLITANGARLLTLDLLTPPEAAEPLAERLGARRVAADWHAAVDITTACAGLPLALAIVAARAAACPEFPLEALAGQLRDGPALDALETEDQRADVRAVFSWSCRQLSPAADQAFRLLGLHQGPELSLPAAASMVGLPATQASRALSELALAHLITEPVPGRFASHEAIGKERAEP